MKTKKIIFTLIIIIVFTIIFFEDKQKEKNVLIVEENGFVQVFFCDLQDCRYEFINFFNTSEQVFCAFYDINDKEIQKMIQKNNINIKKHEPTRNGLMHHKFCVTQKKKNNRNI